MGLGHNSIAGKLLTGTTAGDALPQNAVTGVAVANIMFFHTALTAAFHIGRAATAVKAALT